jgi:hypothetical protein
LSARRGACRLAEPWLLGQDTRLPPVATVDGREVPLEAGLHRAAAMRLWSTAARRPADGGISMKSHVATGDLQENSSKPTAQDIPYR